MIKKLFIAVLFVFGSAISVNAQQVPQYSLTKYDKYKMNPGYAGLDFSLSMTANYRNQWQGIVNNPSEQNINVHMPFYIWSGALGAEITNDQIGLFQRNSFKLGYNYVLASSSALIGVGAKAGVTRIGLQGADIITQTGIYDGGVFDHQDPILPESLSSGIVPVLDIGAYYKSKNMELGISLDNIAPVAANLGNASIQQDMVADLFVEYKVGFNDDIDISPSLYVQSDFSSLQSEIFVEGRYRKNVFGGIGLRGYSSNSLDAIYFVGGAKISKHFTISYAYDFGISELRQYYDGSHEIIINYNLNKALGIGVPQKIIYNPRFL